MTIPVKTGYTHEEAVTTRVFDEAGDLVECDHAGAEEEEMDFVAYSWWEDAHMMVPDDSTTELVLVCDKQNCRAWQGQDGIWNDNN